VPGAWPCALGQYAQREHCPSKKSERDDVLLVHIAAAFKAAVAATVARGSTPTCAPLVIVRGASELLG